MIGYESLQNGISQPLCKGLFGHMKSIYLFDPIISWDTTSYMREYLWGLTLYKRKSFYLYISMNSS